MYNISLLQLEFIGVEAIERARRRCKMRRICEKGNVWGERRG
jgi:hypothetical protein